MRIMRVCILCMVFAAILLGVTSGQENVQDLELKSSLQAVQISQGDQMTVTASLFGNNEIMNSAAFKRHLRISAHITQPDNSPVLKALFDNGIDGDTKAADGVYTAHFKADQAGDYAVKVIAEGKGFRKMQEHTFRAVLSGQAETPQTAVVHEKPGEKAAAAAEKPETVSRDPWTVFLLINAGAALCWIAGFLFLYLRARAARPVRVEKIQVELGQFIKAQAEEKIKQLAHDDRKQQDKETADSRVINELRSARLQFLKAMIEGAKKSGEEMQELWNQIYQGFDNSLKTVLQGKKAAIDEIDDLQEKVEEIGSISEELKGAKALADEQSKKIAFLMSFKDVIAESQQKFDSLKKKNLELEQILFDAAQNAGLGDVMKEPLAEFKENYRQLELCVATLEHENERLVDELAKWQKELDQLKKHGSETSQEAIANLMSEKSLLQQTISDLEASVKTKEKELAAAAVRFESLEAEYMVLYQEKQAASQQPDI